MKKTVVTNTELDVKNDCKYLILVASPRQHGNCDIAAQCVQEELLKRQKKVEIIYLREYTILPCIGCEHCEKISLQDMVFHEKNSFLQSCPLSFKDESAVPICALLQAQKIWFISPVYMYHMPSIGKSLIDRLQPFWHAKKKHIQVSTSKHVYPILIAGRKKGTQLFKGIEHTLHYAFSPLNAEVLPALELRGIDEKYALQNSLSSINALRLNTQNILG